MGLVGLDKSVSLDGFITGPNPGPGIPLGEGGERIFAWMMTEPEAHRDGSTDDIGMLSEAYNDVIGGSLDETGAVIIGKRMFEMIDNPDGWVAPNGYQFTWPVFVLTHEVREPVTKGKTAFVFINDGIESALAQAKAAASDKNIGIAGENVARQFIQAGLLDEISIHLVPVFLDGSVWLFDHLGVSPRELEFTGGKQVAGVTHLRFRFRNARNAQ